MCRHRQRKMWSLGHHLLRVERTPRHLSLLKKCQQMSNRQRFQEKVKMGKKTTKKRIADINEGDEEDTQDNASSPKEIESPEAEPEEEEGEELEESSLVAGGPSDDIASPAPEESKEADDGGVLLGNLLDTEDISSSAEEGLLEDTSNGMDDISEPLSTDGLVDNLEAVVREQEEPWRQESKKIAMPTGPTAWHGGHDEPAIADCGPSVGLPASFGQWTTRQRCRAIAAVEVPCCDQACDVLGLFTTSRCAYRKTCYVVSVSVLWWTVLRLWRRTTATSGSSATAALT
ncbi:hypothetical protein MRX96_052391 [Rhipicephalus microplus]